MRSIARPIALVLALMVAPAGAAAEPSKAEVDAAQKLFDEALALMAAGKFSEACPKLSESQRLDPGMGTKFRLAECYESAGLVGSAWLLFGEVAEDAKAAGRADREAQSRTRATALDKRVPWMTLAVPAEVSGLAGLEVKRDGESVAAKDFGKKLAVDPGAHTVIVTASGKKAWQQTVRALEGGSVELAVPALEDAPPAATVLVVTSGAPVVEAAPEDPNKGRAQRITGIVAGVAGLGAIVAGIGLTVVAKGNRDDAIARCPGGKVVNCKAPGLKAIRGADSLQTTGIVVSVAGGVAVVGGVLLWLFAPSPKEKPQAFQIVPSIGPGEASMGVRGSF